MLLDLDRIKSDFPILQQKVHGNRDLVYLDSAATSQKPNQVIDAYQQFLHLGKSAAIDEDV